MSAALVPLPVGFGVVFDPATRVYDDGAVVLGGNPRRMLRLSPAGIVALRDVRAGPVHDAVTGQLARRMVAAGVAHPRPPLPGSMPTLRVIVPVRDRTRELARCLAPLEGLDVLVVDDGSDDPATVAEVAARHGASLLARSSCGGPAAARNSGLAVSRDVELVAFVDSDCVVAPGWLTALVAHFADPVVGAVAPRIRSLRPQPEGADGRKESVVAAYSARRSPLDMGPHESRVRPGSAMSYVPSATLVVRRAVFDELAGGFDEQLRYGEDVDVIWRMVDAGWDVRYEPASAVRHEEPAAWSAFLSRRFHYGTSAGPLARRHPDRLAPVVFQPWPTAVTVVLASGRPRAALALSAIAGMESARRLRHNGLPAPAAAALASRAVTSTVLGVGRFTAQLALPLAAGAAAAPLGRRGARAVMVTALLCAPALAEWVRRRPELDPVRWTAANLADDVAYGAGVWRGAVAARTVAPLRPRKG